MGFVLDEQIHYLYETENSPNEHNKGKPRLIWAGKFAATKQMQYPIILNHWNMKTTARKEMDQKITKYCRKYDPCATNTHFIPAKNNTEHRTTWQNLENGVKTNR